MNRNLIFKVLVALLFIGVAVIWLLSAIGGILPEGLNLSWVIAIFAGGMGIVFILKGIFQKNVGVIKKFNIFFGAAFIAAGVLALVGTVFTDENVKLVLPIIAIVMTAAILLSILVVGGRKWDSGDNQKVGYKNYYQRKEEEEKKNRDK